MLGFNSHLMDREGNIPRNFVQQPASMNEREHRDLSGLMGAYSSQHHGPVPQHTNNFGGVRDGTSGRGDVLLSQSGVSHSTLVNSGNAAILGHNSFKLSGANQMAGSGAHGPSTLGSTYGAVAGNS